ncbi:MAG: hypothetical protein ABIS27_03595 [Longimicrobiales bacterium]
MAEMHLDRRGFLRTTAGGAVAIVVASLLPAGCSTDYPQAASDRYSLLSLTDKEYATARSAAEAMLVGAPVTAASVAQAIDRELAAVGDPIRTDMKTVLGLIEHGTILNLHARRFTALSAADRLSNLDSWARSRIDLRRAGYQALRSFVVYFAYIQDTTRPLTHFEGTWPERKVPIAAYPVDFGGIA